MHVTSTWKQYLILLCLLQCHIAVQILNVHDSASRLFVDNFGA